MFAKLENGKIKPYRQPLHTDEGDVFTNNRATLAEHGYYPLYYTAAPETDEKHYAVPHWEQGESEIVQVWTVEEVPETDEISDSEALLIIAEGEEA